jgi:hypothetical protein
MAAYLILSGVIFLVVGILHLIRVIRGLPVQIGGAALPMWVSWIGLFVTLALGVWGLVMAGCLGR